MKLREFMANSLPRMRGRKKKEANANSSSSSSSSGKHSDATAADSGSTATSTAATPAAKHGKHCKVASRKPTAVDAVVKSSPAATPAKTQGSSHGNWFQFHESRFAFLERLVGKESPVKRLFDQGGSKDHKPSNGVGRSRSPPHSTPPAPEPRVQPHRSPSPSTERESTWPGKAEDRRRQSLSTSSAVRGCTGLYGSVEVIERYAGLPQQKWCQCPPGGLPCLCPESGLVCGGSCPSQRRYRLTEPDVDAASLYSQGCGHSYAESVTSYDSTPGSQRGPRSRSRIRTNPWLPSPRPSPYSVRSFSSPCASSRSPSPSPSFSCPPPSLSTIPDKWTPASASRESHTFQRHHYRRHRRHHSDVVTSELEPRELTSETPLTDTEQYFSTLDSGIGETSTSTSPDEKDKEGDSNQFTPAGTAIAKKHFVKRKSSERESHFFAQLKGFSLFSGAGSTPSPSPKFRPKLRPKVAKSSHQATPSSSSSTRGIVVNRDSKFWDSDSSVSPPCPTKNYQATARSPGRHSWLGSRESEHFWDYEDNNNNVTNNNNDSSVHDYNKQSHGSTERIQKKENLGIFSSRKFFRKDITIPAELSRREAFDDSHQAPSPSLSPCCEDIGVITSNIEQLAHNLSYEYEDEPNVSFRSSDSSHSSLQTGKHTYKFPDNKESFVSESCGKDLSKNLNYITDILNDFDKGKCPEKENKISKLGQNLVLTDLQTKSSTTDVCLQTDFVDEDEEENSGSDWLPSTESGSDWLTPSNGSGSDWPISGGSGYDWLAGDGSGCATEEDVDCSGKAEQEEEVTNVAEGGKVWAVPDVMQDSTDTGYSSLSRDGRVVNNSNNSTTTDIESTDSATEKSDSNSRSGSVAPKQKSRPESSTVEVTKNMNPTKPDPRKNSGHCPENPLYYRSELAATSTTRWPGVFEHYRPTSDQSSSDSFDNAAEDDRQGKELFSCTLNLATEGKKCFVKVHHHHYGLKERNKAQRNDAREAAENRGTTLESVPSSSSEDRCYKCKRDHLRELDDFLWASPEFQNEMFSCDPSGVIPYPYDVTRFADVSIPIEKRERLGSVSPCCPRSSSTTSSRRFEDLSQTSPFTKEKAFLPRSSTPSFRNNVHEDHSTEHDEKADDFDDDDDDEEFCFCSSPKDSLSSSVIYTGEAINSMTSPVVCTVQPKDEKIKSSSSFFRRFSKKNRQEAASSSLLATRSCAEKEKCDKKSEGVKPHSRYRRGSEDKLSENNHPSHISSPKRPTQLETHNLNQSFKSAKCRQETDGLATSGGTSERRSKEHSKTRAAAASRDSSLSGDNCPPTYLESLSNGQSVRQHKEYCLSKKSKENSLSNSSMGHYSDVEAPREHGDLRNLEAREGLGFRRRRSLGDVISSLEDQVLYLQQHGKHATDAVQRKIREMQEEERLRQQHHLRFQRLLDVHRKRVLLETLQDLRQRLLSQSARLQASYSSVLDMRKRQM